MPDRSDNLAYLRDLIRRTSGVFIAEAVTKPRMQSILADLTRLQAVESAAKALIESAHDSMIGDCLFKVISGKDVAALDDALKGDQP